MVEHSAVDIYCLTQTFLKGKWMKCDTILLVAGESSTEPGLPQSDSGWGD